MKILFTGKGGRAGSWKIRGEQLGKACGAVVKERATIDDLSGVDLVVMVKRPLPDLILYMNQAGIPWVWDVVDFYPQPACTNWAQSYAIKWVKKQIKSFGPSAVIWPNSKMMSDCSESDFDTVIYHHHRPNIPVNPIRDSVRVVGYDGNAKYLGSWADELRRQCNRRGWNFVVNEGTHADWDICVAFRSSEYNGYVQRNWKSNVKLANAHGSGTPFIGAFESGYIESNTGAEVYCSDSSKLGAYLYFLSDYETRFAISESFLDKKYCVNSAAKDFLDFSSGVLNA